jgi:hypothetical protein
MPQSPPPSPPSPPSSRKEQDAEVRSEAFRDLVRSVARDEALDGDGKMRAIHALYRGAGLAASTAGGKSISCGRKRTMPEDVAGADTSLHGGIRDDDVNDAGKRPKNGELEHECGRAYAGVLGLGLDLSREGEQAVACTARDGHYCRSRHGEHTHTKLSTDANGVAWVCLGTDSNVKILGDVCDRANVEDIKAGGVRTCDSNGNGCDGSHGQIAAAPVAGSFPGVGAPRCEHYQRKAWIKADCCGQYYPCRFCHDAVENHEIDRHATKYVGCTSCGAENQPAVESCGQCGTRFAAYFCKVCVFYDDTPGKDIYHCHKCGLCRVGKGLGVDNFHCDRCNSCVPLNVAKSHPCMERSLECNCPICSEYMATSREQVVFMRCGHAMHASCFTRHTATRYTCPICSKSLTNMESWYRALDDRLASEPIPLGLRSKRSRIYCNDCDLRSTAKYHFMFHRCNTCAGYNTRVLSHFDSQGDVAAGDVVTDLLPPSPVLSHGLHGTLAVATTVSDPVAISGLASTSTNIGASIGPTATVTQFGTAPGMSSAVSGPCPPPVSASAPTAVTARANPSSENDSLDALDADSCSDDATAPPTRVAAASG